MVTKCLERGKLDTLPIPSSGFEECFEKLSIEKADIPSTTVKSQFRAVSSLLIVESAHVTGSALNYPPLPLLSISCINRISYYPFFSYILQMMQTVFTNNAVLRTL